MGVAASRMTVPEATVDHYHGLELRQYDVGLAGQLLAVQAETEPHSVKHRSGRNLGPGVF